MKWNNLAYTTHFWQNIVAFILYFLSFSFFSPCRPHSALWLGFGCLGKPIHGPTPSKNLNIPGAFHFGIPQDSSHPVSPAPSWLTPVLQLYFKASGVRPSVPVGLFIYRLQVKSGNFAAVRWKDNNPNKEMGHVGGTSGPAPRRPDLGRVVR